MAKGSVKRTSHAMIIGGRRRGPLFDSNFHVGIGLGEVWVVTRHGTAVSSTRYRLKCHAMAFARAMAFRSDVEMIVHELDGHMVVHQRPSLTYPIALD